MGQCLPFLLSSFPARPGSPAGRGVGAPLFDARPWSQTEPPPAKASAAQLCLPCLFLNQPRCLPCLPWLRWSPRFACLPSVASPPCLIRGEAVTGAGGTGTATGGRGAGAGEGAGAGGGAGVTVTRTGCAAVGRAAAGGGRGTPVPSLARGPAN